MILQCLNPTSLLRGLDAQFHQTILILLCLADIVWNERLICCLSLTGKKPAFSDKVSCFSVVCFCFCFVSCLYSSKSAEDSHISSLLFCSPPPQQEGKRLSCICVRVPHICCRILLPQLSLFLTHPSFNSAGLLGSIYPKYKSFLYHLPWKGMTEVVRCQGRNHRCQSNYLPGFEPVIQSG